MNPVMQFVGGWSTGQGNCFLFGTAISFIWELNSKGAGQKTASYFFGRPFRENERGRVVCCSPTCAQSWVIETVWGLSKGHLKNPSELCLLTPDPNTGRERWAGVWGGSVKP